MKKKLFTVLLGCALMLSISTSAFASSTTWSLYGQDSTCPSCMYVTSQGTINAVFTAALLKFSGYGSTVWGGGYGASVTLWNETKTIVTYVTGGTSTTPHIKTQTFSGLNQVLTSNTIQDTYASNNLWGAKVYSQGYTQSEDFYYSAVGAGDHGL